MTDEKGQTVSVGSGPLLGGFYCRRCGESGPYPIDATTPAGAHRIDFDSCPSCDPDGEDSFRYYDREGRELSLFASPNTEISNEPSKQD